MSTVDCVVHFGILEMQEKIETRQDSGGSQEPVYTVPRSICAWRALFADADIRIVPVHANSDFGGDLLFHSEAGWICMVNGCGSAQDRTRSLCRFYCEWLMRDCPVLGMGCPEVYPVPLAEMRRRIADAVTAELC